MKLAKLPHEPAALLQFFQDGLEALGALCERTWHDRLQVVAEGRAARLWHENDALAEGEIWFPPPEDPAPRQAAREVFPGCPLTFRLVETLHGGEFLLQRAVLQPGDKLREPAADVAERLWHVQFPGTTRWRMESNFVVAPHFSLVALVRCEIQAMDQHWSLHRLAVSLPEGETDEDLEQNLGLLALTAGNGDLPAWPAPDPAVWQAHLRRALERNLHADLAGIQQRQENYLRRELDRVDAYYENYEQELTGRLQRSKSFDLKTKLAERRKATRAEHERRRADQVQRHEIRVIPHVDALLLLAEPAWRVALFVARHDAPHRQEALWVPRKRCWSLTGQTV